MTAAQREGLICLHVFKSFLCLSKLITSVSFITLLPPVSQSNTDSRGRSAEIARVYCLIQSASERIENYPWSPTGSGSGLRGKGVLVAMSYFYAILYSIQQDPAMVSQESSKQLSLFRAMRTQHPLQPWERGNHNTPKIRLNKAATGHR